ncbi:ArsO family NAD(P)H-dependent flavin-containing monooxygenase [Deinococcus sp. NW-56]|uniref:ArsO family NAD(P)H-dependent flavin-containing monooxygenase n=1 Tax=Deinococcus sp. NW-56 TaxID=2080419 RepID=UPI000CF5393E|nr:ArsO family NAD(P)H-dependent flavin-containing monooxygenase [Deinococcus sp. NW-56]
MPTPDVIVVGAGQAGLAVARELSRTALSFSVLDAQDRPGAAWRHAWDSLRLFSPARWSSLPGFLMPGGEGEYPQRDEVIAYLAEYERRYGLPVERPVRVRAVTRDSEGFRLETSQRTYSTRFLVSATGTWEAPFIPDIPGREQFGGTQVHSAFYRRAEDLAGQRVLIVGGGNSGAQILAEVSRVADVTWATLTPPSFLPDDLDGRVLFGVATQRYRAQQAGAAFQAPSLGDIVMVAGVREARDRGVLRARELFTRMTGTGVVWPDGSEEAFDAVIWCTGFRPALDYLAPLGVLEPDGRVQVNGTRSVKEPHLWLVGYGNWTGFASATLIGVGRSAKATVAEIREEIREAAGQSTTLPPP